MKISEKRALVLKRQKAKEKELAKKKKEQEKEAKRAAKAAEKAKKKHKETNKETAEIKSDKQKSEFIQVFPDARKYKTTLTKKYLNRKVWQRPDPQEIKSIIPGVVTSLEIKEGDHVTKGSHIMTFEAMKMQNLVMAPFDGTVETIFVKEGEKVPKGGLMLFIKSDTEFEIIQDKATSTDLGLIE